MDRRLHRILDTLFKTLERQGINVKPGKKRDPYFEVGGEKVIYRLRERQK